MKTSAHLRTERRSHGAAWITLARTEKHNAFDAQLIAQLQAELAARGRDPSVRCVVLAADGQHFCAGADLEWMRHAARQGREENVADARRLVDLLRTLDELDKPTLALVHGCAFGGGVGLVACCDIAIASGDASFCFSEVKLGLVPAVISPFVVAAIGGRNARRYFQTAEVFGAEVAHRIGLVHEVVARSDLEMRAVELAAALSACAPGAKAASKRLIREVLGGRDKEELSDLTTRAIADVRAGDEAREGIEAFLEKRKPRWHE